MPQTTTQRLYAAIAQLSEGDRVRALQFCEAMIQQRQGKRQQRASRFTQK